ncbi:MAG: hypothetical protein IJI73_06630 [Kiritimatiellae bacterium]|nr:hypothetical protein [Kiritimatiellia bacterium]
MEEHKTGPGDAPKFDARLAEGVAYFEQMLEIMPEDRTTLEFLVVAYEQLGQHEKERKALVGLAQILVKERDLQALSDLIPRLEQCDDPKAKAILLKAKMMMGPAPDLTPEAPKELTDNEKRAFATIEAVKSELHLADMLREGGILGDEDAELVRQHLGASSSANDLFLISALQILEKENKPKCDRAIEFLADKFGTPPIPLGAFDVKKEMFEGCSELVARLRGVVPFAKLGSVTLVATLNPADEALRGAFAALGTCRYFLTTPEAVEAALAKVFEKKEDGK